jgi:general secretion pathway protein H
MLWHEAVKVSWSLSEELAKSYGLEKAGWMCWPSGEVNAGEITFKLNHLSNHLQWNEILDFTLEENNAEQSK